MPAAAVIPAPIVYIKVVAVKKLVVGFLSGTDGPRCASVSTVISISAWRWLLRLIARRRFRVLYFEEIKAFAAGQCPEYVSMG